MGAILTDNRWMWLQGVSGEFEYVHDPMDALKERRMKEIEEHHKACVTDLPFRPSNPAKKGEWAA
jgi:hypothetical protein